MERLATQQRMLTYLAVPRGTAIVDARKHAIADAPAYKTPVPIVDVVAWLLQRDCNGKLRFAEIRGGQRVSRDNRAYRRLFYMNVSVIEKYSGKPTSISKK